MILLQVLSQLPSFLEYFSKELYDTSHHNNELIINGSDNQFFVRPVAEFTFKVCPDNVMVYKLYLSLLDWYDESFKFLPISKNKILKNKFIK